MKLYHPIVDMFKFNSVASTQALSASLVPYQLFKQAEGCLTVTDLWPHVPYNL